MEILISIRTIESEKQECWKYQTRNLNNYDQYAKIFNGEKIEHAGTNR